jgi:hypothetical protein
MTEQDTAADIGGHYDSPGSAAVEALNIVELSHSAAEGGGKS